VRESLQEREVLLRAARHLIQPLTFVLPHAPEMRPAWMIRLGLFLYDHLGKRELLPGSAAIDLASAPEGKPLKPSFRKGFTYNDAFVDDARLVVVNAVDAAARGAAVLTRTRCASAQRGPDRWQAVVEGPDGRREISARALVNATGPWVSSFLREELGLASPSRVRLVKGSHIVVRRLFEHDRAYILQNQDRRIVFAIPYLNRFTLVGTTDIAYEGELGAAAITAEETLYLCGVVNRYFRHEIGQGNVVWSYAGVRPLYDDASGDPSAVTRDYVFDLDAPAGQAPLLSVFGGKLTTYRRLAEHALANLQPVLGFKGGPWTAEARLPGGDFPEGGLAGLIEALERKHRWLDRPLVRRLALAYGTRAEWILGDARSVLDLGREVARHLFEAELDYLVRHEWARTAEDVLWRRSKLGLFLDDAAQGCLRAWMQRSARAAPETVS
jgi:glycerol-3-phosphate dehydrogenase